MNVYRLMVHWLRFVAEIFFRQIKVVGQENVPSEGPVIFVGNHPNSLIDPVLIVTTCNRKMSFAAKDVLFQSRLLRMFLNALGCVPIRRRQDHGNTEAVDNANAFSALETALADGGSIGIFPEGISHTESHLARLKTGAARIAFSVAKSTGQPVNIVPCGLTYFHPRRFRSRVFVQYGPPLVVPPPVGHAAESDDANRERVLELTSDIQSALMALTINAPDWGKLRLLDAARRMYQPKRIKLKDRVELSRRFAAVYTQVQAEPDVMALSGRIEEFMMTLDDVGLTERELQQSMPASKIAVKTLRNVMLLCLWLPLSAPGLLLHAPMGFLCGLAAQQLSPRKDVVATTKVIAGMLGLILFYLAALVWLWLDAGWFVGLMTALLLPLSGYAAIRVLECGVSLNRLRRRVWNLLLLNDTISGLRVQRQDLEIDVVRIVNQYIPDEMIPLFPRDTPDASNV